MELIELFCKVDDFCNEFLSTWETKLICSGEKQRNRSGNLSLSERLTIMINFHQSDYKTFKHYYKDHVCKYLKGDFPNLISYTRFIGLIPLLLIPLCYLLHFFRGKVTGISYIDSTPIAICKNIRIERNKVFKGIAKRGKNTMGWFFGFKVHIVVNDMGELLAVNISTGNIDDRVPVPILTKNISGKLFADKGYISANLFKELMEKGLQLITTLKGNMKNKFIPMIDKLLLRKRFIIETINDQLKNISQIEHSRHRSVKNCMVNILAGLAAYVFQEKKPALKHLYTPLGKINIAI